MSDNIGREEMMAMLHELDAAITRPLGIVICGGSAAILSYGLRRQSLDIDVLKSTSPLENTDIKKAIEQVAGEHKKSDLWLNDRAKRVYEYLPKDYAPNTQPLPEVFRKLQPVVIEKADFVITKLAYYENIRMRDGKDISEVAFEPSDVQQLYRKLSEIAKTDHVRALLIEANFKEFKPEFVCDKEGFRYQNAKAIAEYALERYGQTVLENEQQEWESELSDLTATGAGIVSRVDRRMAELIRLGDKTVAACDLAYRTSQGRIE